MLTQHNYNVQCPLANSGNGGKVTFALGIKTGQPAPSKAAVAAAYVVHAAYWAATGKPLQAPKTATGAFVVTAMALHAAVAPGTIGNACGKAAAWRNWVFAGAQNTSSALQPGSGRVPGLSVVKTHGNCGYGTAKATVLYKLVYVPAKVAKPTATKTGKAKNKNAHSVHN